MIVRDLRTDPDVAIVAKDDASSTEKVVEVVLAAFDERGRDGENTSLKKIMILTIA